MKRNAGPRYPIRAKEEEEEEESLTIGKRVTKRICNVEEKHCESQRQWKGMTTVCIFQFGFQSL